MPLLAEIDEWMSALLPFCCGCWLLPLAVVGIAAGVSQSIKLAWRRRGLEQDGVYCGRCRFDLRGGTGWTCPECGLHLAGRLLVREIEPPINGTWRGLINVILVFGPAAVVLVLIASVLPMNYEYSRRLDLTYSAGGQHAPISINLYADGQVGLLGSRRAEEVLLTGNRSRPRYGSLTDDDPESTATRYLPPRFDRTLRADSGWRDSEAANQAWRSLASFDPSLVEGAHSEAIADEFRAIVDAFGRDDNDLLRGNYRHFAVSGSDREYFSMHPLYIFFALTAMLTVLLLVIVNTARYAGQASEVYRQRLRMIDGGYQRLIERNAERHASSTDAAQHGGGTGTA